MIASIKKKAKSIKQFYDKINIDENTKNLIVISMLIILFLVINNPSFISVRSLKGMAFQIPEIGVLVLALSIVMIAGGIDLSIVSIANLSAITAGTYMLHFTNETTSSGFNIFIVITGILIAALVGVVAGLINGLFVAYLKIPPILVTLGSMSLFSGIAVVISKGTAIYGFPKELLFIGEKTFGFITIPLIIFMLIAVFVAILLNKTIFGRRIYLIGTNIDATRFAGIRTKLNILYAYLFSGLLASMAGIITLAKSNSAKADYGSTFVLQSILIAILGGVDPDGGEGKVSGIIMSIITVQFISTGFTFLRVNDFVKGIAWGALLLVVIILKVRKRVKE